MVIIYIILGVVLVGLLLRFLQTKKENNSPYFKIKKKLEDDLLQANFVGDWRKRQEINLQLLWLKTIKEVKSKDILRERNDNEQNSLLAKLTEDELKFPTKWKIDDFYHFPFSQEILAGYGKTLAENDYKVYKPEGILPFPKEVIKKAIYFTFDYLNYDKPLYEIPDKQKVADNLNTVKFILLENFVDTTCQDLPKDGIENFRVGKQLREEQPFKEENDLHLIDWRSYMDWMVKGVHYIDDKQYDDAFICFDKSKELNPGNKDLKIVMGIAYLTIAEHNLDKGNKQVAVEYMKKSAEFENENATKWLSENI